MSDRDTAPDNSWALELARQCRREVKVVNRENDTLRALLAECRAFVAAFPGTTTSTLLARLDAALGGRDA